METDLMISAINEIHQNANKALEYKDVNSYLSIFDEQFKFTSIDGKSLFKKNFIAELTKFFKSVKEFQTSQYRIKSSFEDDIFTEKIARKSVIKLSKLFILSKKETIQTEEVFHWKNINGIWKVTAVEVVLEEKY